MTTEFDEVAGSAGGMSGGPPPFLRISAEQRAREALEGFDRAAALVFPDGPTGWRCDCCASAARATARGCAARPSATTVTAGLGAAGG